MSIRQINFTSMKNMGKKLLAEINRLSINKTKLALKIGKSSRTLYNWFDMEFVPWEFIELIGVHHPGILTAFSDHPDKPKSQTIKENKYKSALELCQEERDDWKGKYTVLIEKYTALLEGGARK